MPKQILSLFASQEEQAIASNKQSDSEGYVTVEDFSEKQVRKDGKEKMVRKELPESAVNNILYNEKVLRTKQILNRFFINDRNVSNKPLTIKMILLIQMIRHLQKKAQKQF